MAKLSKKVLVMVTATKDAFKSVRNRDLLLSDEVLAMVIDRAGDKWDDMTQDEDNTELLAFLERSEREAAAVSTLVDQAISVLVSKIDPQAEAEIMEDVEAVMRGKVTAVNLYAQFKRIYTKDELDGMAWPGTDKDSRVGNHKIDIVKTKTSNGTDITVVWTNDFVSAMSKGKEWELALADITKEEKAPGSSLRYKNWSKAELKTEKSDLTARRNALRSMVKRTITLHHQFNAVLGMPKVNLHWCKAKGDKAKFIAMPEQYGKASPVIKVTASPKNIWMYPKGESENGVPFSVTQLLAFDVTEALKQPNGGTMAELTATASKGSDDTADGDGDGSDMDEGQAYVTFNRQVNYLQKRDNMANVRRILSDRKNDTRKDWLENVGAMYHLIAPLYKQFRKDIEEVSGSPQTEADAA